MAEVNMNSILDTVKHKLNIEPDYTYFDPDIIDYINSQFLTLHQLGVGPDNGFEIEDNTSMWIDFLPNGNLLNAVKIYIKCKVQLQFDPPSSSFVLDAIKQQIAEAEWRMNVEVDPGEEDKT